MQKIIEKKLPNQWDLIIKDGNQPPVTETLRRQLKKLRPTRSKKSTAPLAIIVFFKNGSKVTLNNISTH
jgi:hypothetical protein